MLAERYCLPMQLATLGLIMEVLGFPNSLLMRSIKALVKGMAAHLQTVGEKRKYKGEKTRERFQGSIKGSNKQLNLSVPVWLMETGEVIFTVGMPGAVLKKERVPLHA